MIVEFNTVCASFKESFEKGQFGEMIKTSFENEDDYITSTSIDMDDIIGFTGGRVWYNNKELGCVYADQKDGITPNLLITYQQFKELYNKVRKVDIKTWEEILDTNDKV